MAGPKPQEALSDQIGVVQTPLGPFVRETYAADCARFLEELEQRRSSGEDLQALGTQTRAAYGVA
jgi:hypothetical protein